MEVYYAQKQQLDKISQADKERKSLIALAVVQALRLSSSKVVTTKKNSSYEIIINRLKQEKATGDKLFESKIDQLKDEIESLKQKLKDQEKHTSKNTFLSPPRSRGAENTSFSTSPFVSKLFGTKGYLSPTVNSLSKSMSSPQSILSPIQPKKKQLAPIKAKKTYTNYNNILKGVAQGLNGEDILKQRLEMSSDRIDQTSVSYNTPSKEKIAVSSFLTDGDEEDDDDDEDGMDDVETTFVSANSSLNPGTVTLASNNDNSISNNTNETVNNNKNINKIDNNDNANDTNIKSNKKRKKKLQLRKPGANKILKEGTNKVGSLKFPSNGLSLEDEETNTLNYYQDSNFTEDFDDSIDKNSKELSSSQPLLVKKKKKNIFKID